MDLRTAERILAGIEATTAYKLSRELLATAIRYAHIRASWQLASVEEQKEMNLARRAAHNVLIDACNILSRRMAATGEDISWRAMLGDDRREIGDFACWLHAILGIRSR